MVPRVPRPSRVLPLAAALLVLPGATAIAQAPAIGVTLSPNTAGDGSRLQLTMDGSQLGLTPAQTPKGVRLDVQPGFKFDVKAVAERCKPTADKCPDASKIASGTASAAINLLGLDNAVNATLTAYLAAPQQSGDLAGIVLKAEVPSFGRSLTSTGRVLKTAGGGLQLRFDDVIGGAAVPAGVQVALKQMSLTAGASRTVTTTKTKKKKVKVKGSKRKVTKKVKVKVRTKHHLLTNPRTCSGTWTGTATVALSDGSERPFPVAAQCAP